MSAEEPPSVGPWRKVKVLGRGGFGQVTLWHNSNSNQNIAIKRLRENEQSGTIKSKHKERWCKEVQIMKKLNHLNIVTALSIPEELNVLTSSPMLAMEFCCLGDLRQVLAKPENCCGLKESSVVAILTDISNGLSYLHSCKVIHRDLKPDNIVLQKGDSRVVYKLIDLGYAKELDQNSVCESFVGTIQYLAPELFLGKTYTCSVDYWSFGLVAHEVITGYRPFLPGFTPANWMKQVQNKPRNIISVIENISGNIIRSSSISKVNHVSRCFLQEIEKWLQLALDWNGHSRGRDIETNELVLFESLAKILKKKIIQIFSMPTYEILSYEIEADTRVSSLQTWILRDTGLEIDDQMLLLPGGKCIKANGSVLQCIQSEAGDANNISMFLYSCGAMRIKSKTTLKPLYVKELLEDPKKLLEYTHLKRSCSDSVFFIHSEANLYSCLLFAIKVKIENIKHRTAAVQTLYEDVAEEWNQVETLSQFLMLSHKTDLENYIHLRKSGEISSTSLVQKWIQKANDMEKKLSELRNSCNKNQQKLSVATAKQNCVHLESSASAQANEKILLKDLVEDAQKLWDRVQKIPRDVRGNAMSNTDMVKVLYRCLESTSKLLRNSSLDALFAQISEAEEHLAKLVSPLTIWLKSTKIMRQIIENTQKERQKEVWSLIIKQKEAKEMKKDNKNEPAQEKEKSKDESSKAKETTDYSEITVKNSNNNQFSPFHIPKTVQSDLTSPIDECIILKPDFKVMEPVSIMTNKTDFNFNSCPPVINPLPQLPDADIIISDNNHWRYRTQDVTHTCHQMIKEIQSLNWDFLADVS